MTNASTKAIQTEYGGRLFRSRLEARWAVLMDAAAVQWQYEHEGYECERRLELDYDEPKIWWLPDFRIPRAPFHDGKYGNLHEDPFSLMEVKGRWTEDALRDFLNAVASLGTCHNDYDCVDTVVAGPIPTDKWIDVNGWAPWRLHFHKGDMMVEAVPHPREIGKFGMHGRGGFCIARDVGPGFLDDYNDLPESWRGARALAAMFDRGATGPDLHMATGSFDQVDWDAWREYARIAGAARFEHGTSGRTL